MRLGSSFPNTIEVISYTLAPAYVPYDSPRENGLIFHRLPNARAIRDGNASISRLVQFENPLRFIAHLGHIPHIIYENAESSER